ncbi:flagellar biosynthetic protein FliO [Zhongshania sp. BJYM1]|jgi:flagellar protein FliO/FliZ|uniref:flagellar biosynthetic protein FliO n=1 Tax=Zhongshania aquatica TaxID=2965069 RepID=UPI0022B332F7|nr:flagellar biosynthetic protein FliO [Marortus sp. BJYM1]
MATIAACIRGGVSGVLLSLAALPVYAQEVAPKPAASPSLPAGPSYDVSGMVGSMLFVIVCIVGLMWLLRRTRLVSASGQGGVTVVSQIPLSMKEKLLVVQVGDEKLLLGCTSASINTLHSWASAADDVNAKPPESAFAKLLAKRQVMPGATKSAVKTGEQQ